MKILGLSFGRKNKNCDILVKEALIKAGESGAQVRFINTMDLNIGHCKGCGVCSTLRDKGMQVKCILKDDYLSLEEELLNADGIILAAPVYSIASCGQLKNFIDRFGAAHDRAAVLAEQEKRIRAGSKELIDPRVLSNKYVAYISVGGAKTKHWVSMGLPNMYMFGMSTVMKTVGQLNVYDMGRIANPVLSPELISSVGGLGSHLAESIGKPYDQVEWYGEGGICPVCHNSILTMGSTTKAECPLCGIKGRIIIEGEKLYVEFDEAEKKRARNTFAGLKEHHKELQEMMEVLLPKLEANKKKLPKELMRYTEFKSTF
ncbi:MAG: flavodoxin family protein [Anaerocolumna sp.]